MIRLPRRYRCAILAAAALLNAQLSAQSRPTQYDVYMVGVRVAELTVSGSDNARTYTIRKKNTAANTWSTAHSATDQSIQSDTSFRLSGAIRNVAANIVSIGRVDWSAHDLIGWPDRHSLYERARELTVTVHGTVRQAVRWNKRDTSRPMDIIVGADNALLAAIDPPADVVLVRRGYEALTTVGAWMARDISPAKFGYRALGKLLVPMPDGVRLATLVYLPSAEAGEKFPTIFVRTPYGITGLIGGFWHYATRGFAVVLQAARGTSYGDPAGCQKALSN